MEVSWNRGTPSHNGFQYQVMVSWLGWLGGIPIFRKTSIKISNMMISKSWKNSTTKSKKDHKTHVILGLQVLADTPMCKHMFLHPWNRMTVAVNRLLFFLWRIFLSKLRSTGISWRIGEVDQLDLPSGYLSHSYWKYHIYSGFSDFLINSMVDLSIVFVCLPVGSSSSRNIGAAKDSSFHHVPSVARRWWHVTLETGERNGCDRWIDPGTVMNQWNQWLQIPKVDQDGGTVP